MGFKNRREKTAPFEKNIREMSLYLPLSLYNEVKAISDNRKIPISRLINYAIDKELAEGADAFEYECPMPTHLFVEDAYSAESSKIYVFLRKTGPQSIDQLVLARRDIGIIDKELLMLGIRELLQSKVVEEIYPKWMTFKFPAGYRVIAIREASEDKKAARIAKIEAELAQLKGEKSGV